MLFFKASFQSLFQLQLCSLVLAASISSRATSPPTHTLHTSPFIPAQNGSILPTNHRPEDPFSLPWPIHGPPRGTVKSYNYSTPISEGDAHNIFSAMVSDCLKHSAQTLVGTTPIIYAHGAVALKLFPSPGMVWGHVEQVATLASLFITFFESMGFEFDFIHRLVEVCSTGNIGNREL